MTRRPVPDELVQAVHDRTGKYVRMERFSKPVCERMLDAVPDGWAKIDGEWVQISRIFEGYGEFARVSAQDRTP